MTFSFPLCLTQQHITADIDITMTARRQHTMMAIITGVLRGYGEDDAGAIVVLLVVVSGSAERYPVDGW